MQIATGSSHVLALDTAGNVYSWGSNNKGQLGILDPDPKGGKNEARIGPKMDPKIGAFWDPWESEKCRNPTYSLPF